MRPPLHRFLIDYLTRAWKVNNDEHFQGRLKLPVFAISQSSRQLGSWDENTRTLTMSLRLLLRHGEVEIEEVLKHEMAHQYADEILLAHQHPDESAHGTAFRHACSLLGIAHNARFKPHSQPSPLLQRIQKLLALAKSQNVHEAEAAMAKARSLMEKYEIKLGERKSEFHYLYLGRPQRRKSLVQRLLASLLVRFFHVKLVWVPSELILEGKKVWLMELCGTHENLAVAEYVYDFLERELAWLWFEHRRGHPHLKGIKPKREFQVGVLKGLIAKLTEAEQATGQASAGKQIVLLRKSRLDAFFRERHPNRRTIGRSTYRITDAYQAGFQKGKTLEIREGIAQAKEGQPKLKRTKRLGTGIK